MRRLILVSTLVFAAAPALAETPTEAVRFFYSPITYEPDPALRSRFSGPAKSLFEQNDKEVAKNEGVGCIDFSPGIDGQDYDEALVKKTLKLSEKIDGDGATVTARFTLFPNDAEAKRELVWSLEKQGEKWLVTDIQSISGKWKLSEFTCSEPQ